jgi:Tfp pilus assembly protein FimT
MIVIAIIAIVTTAGIPMATRALKKDPLMKVVNDTLEGCKLARDRAILQNRPYDFVIRNRSENEEDEITVEPARQKGSGSGSGAPSTAAAGPKEVGGLVGDFPRKRDKRVAIELLYVNLVDQMNADEAHVRFYPNGTSDEFMVIYSYEGKRRTIKVDIITGSPWEVKE